MSMLLVEVVDEDEEALMEESELAVSLVSGSEAVTVPSILHTSRPASPSRSSASATASLTSSSRKDLSDMRRTAWLFILTISPMRDWDASSFGGIVVDWFIVVVWW